MYPAIAALLLKGAADVKGEGAIGSVSIFFFFVQSLQIVGKEMDYLQGIPHAKEIVAFFVDLARLEYHDIEEDPCAVPACPPSMASFTFQWRFIAISFVQPVVIAFVVVILMFLLDDNCTLL